MGLGSGLAIKHFIKKRMASLKKMDVPIVDCGFRFAEYGTLSKIVKTEGIVQSVWRKEFKRFTGRNSE
jgi:hypothetical protein